MENFFTGELTKEDHDMMKFYTSEVFESMLGDTKCGHCGKDATHRCSKCKNAWYCNRDCQVRAWKSHKPLCELISSNKKADAEKEN